MYFIHSIITSYQLYTQLTIQCHIRLTLKQYFTTRSSKRDHTRDTAMWAGYDTSRQLYGIVTLPRFPKR